MGEAELDIAAGTITIRSVFYFYGDMAGEELASQIALDIASLWNEPKAAVAIGGKNYSIQFDILGIYEPRLDPEQVWYNDNPRFNFFRIEEYVIGDISFVDGLGCNTGYFKLGNLVQSTTTAAHEYGHTLGLEHPANTDYRGQGAPGIMYPRGTLCDAEFQYDPLAPPGAKGGTLNPVHRRVRTADIDALKLHLLRFDRQNRARIGEFSSLYHEKHTPAVTL